MRSLFRSWAIKIEIGYLEPRRSIQRFASFNRAAKVKIRRLEKTKERNDTTSMAHYLYRKCPRCSDYLGIVLRGNKRNVPARAVNGHCWTCGYRLAWIVIRGGRHRVSRRRAKGTASYTLPGAML
jgi:hypothetical protein